MRFFFLFAILISSWGASGKELDIKTFIEEFKKFDIHQEDIMSEMMRIRFNKDLNLPAREWLFTLNAEYGIEVTGGVQTSSQQAGIRRNFLNTGTLVDLSVQKNNQIGREERVESIRLQQSVIQNPLGRQFDDQEQLLEGQNDIIKIQVTETYEDYLGQKINDYLDFILAWQSLKVSQGLYEDALSLKKEVLLRKRKNIALQVDVDRVNVQVLARKNEVIERKKELKRVREILKQSLSEESDIYKEFKPSKEVPYIETRFNFEKEEKRFWEDSRTLELLKISETNAQKSVTIQRRDLYPEGNLILGYSKDDSRRFSATANRKEALIGFSLQYSLDNTAEKAQVEQARLAKIQATYARKKVKKRMKSELRNLKEQIQLNIDQLETLKEQAKVAKRLVRGERVNFEKGRVDLKTYIEAQNSLANARLGLMNQKVTLARAVVNWKSFTDTLFKL